MINPKLDINIDEFMTKVKKMEKGEKLDLSSDQDLSIAIMNLISIEEHLFFSGGKTGNKKFYDLISDIREMRKTLLKKIIPDYEGEVWCISKHLLAGSMRLMEVGTKMQTKKNNKEAYEMFKKAYELYSLFWGLNLGLVDTKGLNNNNKEIPSSPLGRKDEKVRYLAEKGEIKEKGEMSVFEKLGQLVKKAVDCCRE